MRLIELGTDSIAAKLAVAGLFIWATAGSSILSGNDVGNAGAMWESDMMVKVSITNSLTGEIMKGVGDRGVLGCHGAVPGSYISSTIGSNPPTVQEPFLESQLGRVIKSGARLAFLCYGTNECGLSGAVDSEATVCAE